MFDFMRAQVLVAQGREHAWLHAALANALSQDQVDAMRPAIRIIVHTLLTALVDRVRSRFGGLEPKPVRGG